MTTTTDATVEVPAPLNTRLVEARLRMLDLPLPAAGERLPDTSLRIPPGDPLFALVSLLRDDLPALIALVDEAQAHATRYRFGSVTAEEADQGWIVTAPFGMVLVDCRWEQLGRTEDLPADAYCSRDEAIAVARHIDQLFEQRVAQAS